MTRGAGSGGIALNIAIQLTKMGNKVIVMAWNPDALDLACKKLPSLTQSHTVLVEGDGAFLHHFSVGCSFRCAWFSMRMVSARRGHPCEIDEAFGGSYISNKGYRAYVQKISRGIFDLSVASLLANATRLP